MSDEFMAWLDKEMEAQDRVMRMADEKGRHITYSAALARYTQLMSVRGRYRQMTVGAEGVGAATRKGAGFVAGDEPNDHGLASPGDSAPAVNDHPTTP